MMRKGKQRDDDEDDTDLAAEMARERERGPSVPEFGKRGREPITQGERLRWIRGQIGPDMWTPMRREDFVELLHRLAQEGDKPRAATTVFRWERDEGRGPTLKEGVVLARLVGRTAEWLSGLDEYHATLRHADEVPSDVAERILKQGYKSHGPKPETPGSRGSSIPAKGAGPASSTTRPVPVAAKKRRKG